MSWKNRVVWSEGLFLRPQHFQQHMRYIENLVEERCERLCPFPWGFKTLELDSDQLAIGKLRIASASGVFPDGTPFSIPDEDEPPPPLDISEEMHNVIVHLCLPVRRAGTGEVQLDDSGEGLARVAPREIEVRDTVGEAPNPATLQVGSLRLQLLLGSEPRNDYTCLGAAYVLEMGTDKLVKIDREFIPPVLDCRAAPPLTDFMNALNGLLRHRAEEICTVMAGPGAGGVAEISDFLRLQLINRYEPLITHLASLGGLHPERLYAVLLQAAGELATLTLPSKRPEEFPAYRHDDLRATFRPVQAALRAALLSELERRVVPIPLVAGKYMHKGVIADHSLFADADFVLAARAEIPEGELRRRLPKQLTIGSTAEIRQLVSDILRGVEIVEMGSAPRQIPIHAGFTYFKLQKGGSAWASVAELGTIALFPGMELPGLEFELWAIKA